MRAWLAGVGVVALALALTVAAGVVSVSWGGVLVPLAAAVAVVAGAWVAYRDTGRGLGPVPAVESTVGSDPAGMRLNVALGSLVGRERVELTGRGVRDALRDVATAVVASRDGVSAERAASTVDDGSWTGDRVASRFLAASWSLPVESTRERVARAVGAGGERPLVVAARRGANAVAERAGIVGPDAPARTWFPPAAGEGAVTHTVDVGASTRSGDSEDADAEATDGADGDATDGGGTWRRARARTGRYRGVSALALVAFGVGAFVGSRAAAFAGVVAVAYVAWGRAATVPDVSLVVERTFANEDPEPGEHVRVETTVTNVGDARLPECRAIDGVPAALAVVDGSPRGHCALAPGESVTVEYAVEARRGVHEYEGALAVVTDAAGAVEERHVVRGESTIACVPNLSRTTVDVPLRDHTTGYAGNVVTDEGGAGLAFYGSREYRSGDPLSRVDWNRFARTGDLATTEFREERAASVVLVVDGRAAGYVAPDADGPHALDRAVDAAGTLFASLLDAGNRVGIAAVSTSSCWLPPRAGRGHRERARELLARNDALSPIPSARNLRVTRSVDRLRRRISDGAQVFFLTPLCDDRAADIARRFEAGGRAVTVVSPDPTTASTPSRRLARVGRRLRVTGLRQAGVRVVDWAWDEPLAVALARLRAGGDGR